MQLNKTGPLVMLKKLECAVGTTIADKDADTMIFLEKLIEEGVTDHKAKLKDKMYAFKHNLRVLKVKANN